VAIFFPSVEVVRADHGGSARPTGGGGMRALFWFRRRKKKAHWVGWAERPDGLPGRWSDWAKS
jgi:hypothetical protein